jgi:hypothetical protein
VFISGKVFPIPTMTRDFGDHGDSFASVFLRVLCGKDFVFPRFPLRSLRPLRLKGFQIPAMTRDFGNSADSFALPPCSLCPLW